MINVRKAVDTDRQKIAYCIAEGFQKDFSVVCKDVKTVAKALESGIHINRFYVAEENDNIAGVLAVSDCYGRAVSTDVKAYKSILDFYAEL